MAEAQLFNFKRLTENSMILVSIEPIYKLYDTSIELHDPIFLPPNFLYFVFPVPDNIVLVILAVNC